MSKVDAGMASALAAFGLGVEEQARRMPEPKKRDLNQHRARPVVGIRMTRAALEALDKAAHLLRKERPVTRGEALEEVLVEWLAARNR